MKIYLASPLGFADSTKHFMGELEKILFKFGEVINPWNSTLNSIMVEYLTITDQGIRLYNLQKLSKEIGRENEQSIRESDIVFAVLDGIDVDSGTASEIGFAYAIGKKIFGLCTNKRLTSDNEGAIVNLQVQYFIEASGGSIFRTLEEPCQTLNALS